VTTIVVDGMRLIKASERLGAMMEPLTCVVKMAENVREVAPELGPELDALEARMFEVIEHLGAAVDVLGAKAELL
jgi:hypothetical protein